ncbi:uncharacterized protein DNG_09231 [Cephalotrichum gorgonifer]|uniref:Uncharacterized protein n=1 Tax=Cephalotrichum gorgonifer TaxID=2041049 RepID=A0AAE8SZ38_9PEZI|nr:uncharacterized protein DNG_09231 [Cephalotrichum gorgonifer]
MAEAGPFVPRDGAGVSSRAEVTTCIHGSLHEDGHDLATLIIIELEFKAPRNELRRLRSAVVKARFVAYPSIDSTDPVPTVHDIAPAGTVAIVDQGLEKPALLNSWDPLHGRPPGAWLEGAKKTVGSRNLGQPNAAIWKVHKDDKGDDTDTGIPTTLTFGILLRRSIAAKFQAVFDITATIGAKTNATMTSKAYRGSMVATSPLITFDPASSFGSPRVKGMLDLDKNKLSDITLSSFAKASFPVQPGDILARQASHYVELWNLHEAGQMVIRSNPHQLDTYVEKLEGLPCREKPDVNFLNRAFDWVSRITSNAATTKTPIVCSVLMLRSEENVNGTASPIRGHFDKNTLDSIWEFFDLPPDALGAIPGGGGSCYQRTSTTNGHQGYIVQTPSTGRSTWSLILVSDTRFIRGAAILQADGLRSAHAILQKVSKVRGKHPNPLLLLLHLFMDYHEETSKGFKTISDQVTEVDRDILEALRRGDNHGDTASNKIDTPKGDNFAQLNRNLHEASSNLVNIARRNEFEKGLCSMLQVDLRGDPLLTELVNLSAKSDKLGLEIKDLPERISGHRTVLYSLIAQRDASLQYDLSKATFKDSKAMKTLAIITMVFLPATFVATLFSADMISFKSKGQASWIYAVAVVPFTVGLVLAWFWWPKGSENNSDELDEEAGIEGQKIKQK